MDPASALFISCEEATGDKAWLLEVPASFGRTQTSSSGYRESQQMPSVWSGHLDGWMRGTSLGLCILGVNCVPVCTLKRFRLNSKVLMWGFWLFPCGMCRIFAHFLHRAGRNSVRPVGYSLSQRPSSGLVMNQPGLMSTHSQLLPHRQAGVSMHSGKCSLLSGCVTSGSPTCEVGHARGPASWACLLRLSLLAGSLSSSAGRQTCSIWRPRSRKLAVLPGLSPRRAVALREACLSPKWRLPWV